MQSEHCESFAVKPKWSSVLGARCGTQRHRANEGGTEPGGAVELCGDPKVGNLDLRARVRASSGFDKHEQRTNARWAQRGRRSDGEGRFLHTGLQARGPVTCPLEFIITLAGFRSRCTCAQACGSRRRQPYDGKASREELPSRVSPSPQWQHWAVTSRRVQLRTFRIPSDLNFAFYELHGLGRHLMALPMQVIDPIQHLHSNLCEPDREQCGIRCVERAWQEEAPRQDGSTSSPRAMKKPDSILHTGRNRCMLRVRCSWQDCDSGCTAV
jgi:hypothetical protein